MKTTIEEAIEKNKKQMEIARSNSESASTKQMSKFWIGVHDGLETSNVFLWQLLEKEKQIIIDAYKYGLNDEHSDYLDGTDQAEQYYGETFKQ